MTTIQKIIIGTLAVCAFIGCGSAASNLRKYSQSQLTAITTRQVDATYDETFMAAVDSLFDDGYTIAESDKEAGIITGFLNDDRSAERAWISRAIADKTFRISILIRKRGPKLTSVRLSSSINGEPYIDEDAINEFWNQMKRQVLIQEPAPVLPGSTGLK